MKTRVRLYRDSDGFSLVEVLISILMIAGFLATAMQALIAATAIKVKSEEISEATTWMQEDLEAIKFEANRLGFDSVANTYDLAVSNAGGANGCDNGFSPILAWDLQNPPVANPPPYKYPDNNNQIRVSAIGGREYFLQRRLTADENILKIEHQVLKSNGDQISELYSEVIPDVAFACS